MKKGDVMTSEYNSNEDKNKHLAEVHGLVKTSAYILNDAERKKSPSAARAAKHREKKKGEGLMQVYLPIEIAEAIKASRSMEEWLNQAKLIPNEKLKEIRDAYKIANEVIRLKPWKRWVLKFISSNLIAYSAQYCSVRRDSAIDPQAQNCQDATERCSQLSDKP